MREIIDFTNDEFGTVRTVEQDGTVLFCGSDVARCLGYTNPSKALKDHCKGVTKRYTLTNGGNQEISFIPEGDVYRLITHSKLPTAQKFESWVFDEVLPSLRKHGMYAADDLLNNPDFLIQVATELKNEKLKRMQAEEQKAFLECKVEEMTPDANFGRCLKASPDLLHMRDVSKILGIKGLGQNNLFCRLKEDRVLMSDNMPYQEYVNRGYFKVIEGTYFNGYDNKVTRTTMVTQRGLEFLMKKYKGIEVEYGFFD